MCGIFALIHKTGAPVSREPLDKALRRLAHRGPDGQGAYQDGPLGLAHRRLAIFGLSATGQQPMAYLHYHLIYNGAIYNFPELRSELEGRGYAFHTRTDTEVIAAAYDCWGEGCTQRFRGMWAFVLYDQKRKELFCSRDRFGIRPFYYLETAQHFAVASEPKAFQCIPGWQPRLNQARCYEFLAFGWQAHTAESMIEGVRPLPAGCSATYELGNHHWRIKPYYRLEPEAGAIPAGSFEERKAHFRHLLKESVRLRLRADVPVALSLSGGLDSSAVLAVQQELQEGQPLACFSACFPGTPYDESPYIDAVARRYRAEPIRLLPTFEHIMEMMEEVCWHQDEPVASAAVIAHYQLMALVSHHGYKVMLNGQGADEILGGYDKFYLPLIKELIRRAPWRLPLESLGIQRHAPLGGAWQRYRHASSGLPAPPPWLDAGFVPPDSQLFRRSPDSSFAACSLNLIREVGLPVLLQYEDRNAMAHGIESRLPFLDHRLVEYALRLPAADKIRNGKRKYILRRSLAKQLPPKVLHRYQKMGFPTPQDSWMEAQPDAFLSLLRRAIRRHPEILSPRLYAMAEKALKHKRRSFYGVIWRVVSFGAWRNAF